MYVRLNAQTLINYTLNSSFIYMINLSYIIYDIIILNYADEYENDKLRKLLFFKFRF